MFRKCIRFAIKTLSLIVIGIVVAIVTLNVSKQIHTFLLSPAERQLAEADNLADKEGWRAVAPLYAQAEAMFHQQGNTFKETYARVSQIPAQTEFSLRPMSDWLAQVNRELDLPSARDPKTRLRILTIKGQIENDYDADRAYKTWVSVQQLATRQHNFTLANRAYGEQAIGLFLLGDTTAARKHVFGAYAATFVLRDRIGRARIDSLIGSAMVQHGYYQGALQYLDEAITLVKRSSAEAYPGVAVTAKIDALRGLKRFPEAIALSAEAMRMAEQHHLRGHLYQALETRAHIWKDMGDLNQATRDYAQAFRQARELGYWRGLTESGGTLAQAYESKNELRLALSTIDEALNAHQRIPAEMYFAPRNLAIKAEILKRLGRIADSNHLYERSLSLVDSLLITAPTPNLVDAILNEYSNVYSGYFASLCEQKDFGSAFAVIERAHGRLEVEALQNRRHLAPHPPTFHEQTLTALNLQLISTENHGRREQILTQISRVEDQLDLDPWSRTIATKPVSIKDLQQKLLPSELLIEYVLANPVSYALAITSQSVTSYSLMSRYDVESEAKRYISILGKKQADRQLAQNLFQKLLSPIAEYQTHESVIVVPDGSLHLLPMAALHDGAQYVVATHTTSVVSAATVLHILRTRNRAAQVQQPFLGFAPWSQEATRSKGTLATLLSSLRGVDGPQKSDFVPLPESKHEVETGQYQINKLAGATPSKEQLRLGPDATETRFKKLPLAQYRVLHLASHGFADVDHPDRSALVFAPDTSTQNEDGLLQIREIRRLHLSADLVILSACKTGLGPAGEGGIANVSNAFLQANTSTVISSFWPVEDHVTSQFMDILYAHLGQKESKADALRKAGLGMLKDGLAPYYWASFQIVGDPDGTLAPETRIKNS